MSVELQNFLDVSHWEVLVGLQCTKTWQDNKLILISIGIA